MIYPSIRIEGAILSPDIFSRIEDLPGQKPADFGLDSSIKVKDEIVRAWATRRITGASSAQSSKPSSLIRLPPPKLASNGSSLCSLSSATRLTTTPAAAELNGKLYAISHRATNRAQAPVQIVGYREPAGLDRKPENATVRMSAHARSSGVHQSQRATLRSRHECRILRLLRDSSRLIKLSYLGVRSRPHLH